jgi:hypothetical protein
MATKRHRVGKGKRHRAPKRYGLYLYPGHVVLKNGQRWSGWLSQTRDTGEIGNPVVFHSPAAALKFLKGQAPDLPPQAVELRVLWTNALGEVELGPTKLAKRAPFATKAALL